MLLSQVEPSQVSLSVDEDLVKFATATWAHYMRYNYILDWAMITKRASGEAYYDWYSDLLQLMFSFLSQTNRFRFIKHWVQPS